MDDKEDPKMKIKLTLQLEFTDDDLYQLAEQVKNLEDNFIGDFKVLARKLEIKTPVNYGWSTLCRTGDIY